MLRVVVLGSAAGGGIPQWNCGCDVCTAARKTPGGFQMTQASLAISADDRHWFLLNASPDIRQQIIATPRLHPQAGVLRHSPIAGVILTNAEVDAVAGLLSLREGSPFAIYAHPRVLATLHANSIFNVLDRNRVPRRAITLEAAFEPALPDGAASGITVLPFAVPGKVAWYLESGADANVPADDPGDTLGLQMTDQRTGRSFFYLPACARMTPKLRSRIEGAVMIFFDGTLWRDDELIAAGLGHKTGQRMGHMAMSGPDGAIAALADAAIGRKIFLHINNSNPVVLPDSDERRIAEKEGWEIPADGTEYLL